MDRKISDRKISQKGLMFFILFVALFVFGLGQDEGRAQENGSGQRAEATYLVTFKVDLSKHPVHQKVELWLPYPISFHHQDVTSVDVSGTYAHAGVYAERKYGNILLYALWPKDVQKKVLTLSFKVKRFERHSGKRVSEAGPPCFDTAVLSKYLRGSLHAPINMQVRELARQITKDKKGVMEKARAIYDWVCDNMRRDPSVEGCGCGDVCILLDRRRGKCADIHSVFTALLKGAGIPAREVFGLRLPVSGKRDITTWQHCWAEFWVPGLGWFVADPGDYLKALLKKNLNPCSKEARKIREYFFGNVDAFRIRLSTGRDLVLNPSQASAPLNYLMYPYSEVDGKPLDFLSPATFSYQITARRIN